MNHPYTIKVDVESRHLAEQSRPQNSQYTFAYTITIHNAGTIAAKLLTRHWIITDGDGKEQEVRGVGVIGEQPYLQPGEHYQYTSGVVLDTPVGSMRGSYHMVADDDYEFDADVPMFSLSFPQALH